MNFSLTRSNLVSLIMASICLVLFAYFPTRGNVWEDIACMISFFIILPALYIHFILKGSLRDLDIGLPAYEKKGYFALGGAIIIALLCAIGLYFTPYNSDYIALVAPIFSTFKGFAIYHLLFVIPSILLVSFFCVSFLNALQLRRIYTLTFGGLVFCILLISLFDLPPVTAPVFVLPFLLLWYYKSEHIYSLGISVFLGILTYNALIAKALLNIKI